MKLRHIFTAAVALSLCANMAQAEDGELELSGNVTTFAGWQHDDSSAGGDAVITAIPERGATAATRDTFNFYLDEVELDIQKSWGDKVRIRADLDFGAATLGSNWSDFAAAGTAFVLEQGYVGFNVADGEVVVGRFNVPMGVYSVDRNSNVTISYSAPYLLLPTNATGAKLYYPFGENFDIQLYVINNFADTVSTTPASAGGLGGAIPSGGFRLGYNWGEEDKKSTVGLSGAVGGQRAGLMKHLSFIGDLDLSWYITDQFLLQFEGVYRQDNTAVAAGVNDKGYAANLNLDYLINDEWDIYGSYNYLHDWEGVGAGLYTGRDQQVHAGTIGVGYNITDGAKFKIEYRLDWHFPQGPDAGATANTISHAALAAFEYAF